jgi:hypothetical protein
MSDSSKLFIQPTTSTPLKRGVVMFENIKNPFPEGGGNDHHIKKQVSYGIT